MFFDVFDPFSPTRSLSQVLNIVDLLMVNPFLSASRGIEDCGVRRGWDAKETEDSLDMETLDNTITAHNHEEAVSSLLGLNGWFIMSFFCIVIIVLISSF